MHAKRLLSEVTENLVMLRTGNFIEILTLVAAHDSIVQEKLQNGPRNAVYTSP